MSRTLLFALLTAAVAAVAPVRPGHADAEPLAARAGDRVVLTAHDHGYTGPDRVPAGMTTVEIINRGQHPHHAQIVKLAVGKTAQDFTAAMKADPLHWPSWVSFVGGPNGVVPGERASATMHLDSGQYLALCLIPDTHGVPHMMLGMEKEFTVVPVRVAAYERPAAALTITQRDFHFDLSRPITAGVHTIEVINGGSQPHEVVVVQLAPGATVKDFVAAFEPGASGPPPGKLMGGVVGIDRGGRAFFTATFQPGQYALLCFLPDQHTGKEHFTQGMIREFTINE
jgi:hypothetical protein